jgi:putative MATE family efflux protein
MHQDLTTGPLVRHLLKTTSFILVTMVFQTLYFLVDLYWVGRLGTVDVAGVAVAGNLTFIVLALSQMLGVGTTTLISHAAGRKEIERGRLVFNQSQVLSIVTGVLFLIIGMLARMKYARALSADEATAQVAGEYLLWFIPAMALQFTMVAMSSALRGVGDFRTGMVIGTVSIVLNMAIAPFLIFGWGTGRPLGVAGAAIASLIAVLVGVLWLTSHFVRGRGLLKFDLSEWRPRIAEWRRLLAIGLPAGFEFALMGVYLAIVYTVSKPFGAHAQAGFGIGMRVVQAAFMPVVALGFSVAPVAGQNFGAGRADRVKETFRAAAMMASALMLIFAIASHVAPAAMIDVFSDDAATIAVGEEYLRIISWNFVAAGIVFVSSSMFQAMGNTVPALVTSAIRVMIVAFPAVMLARMPGFRLNWIWYLSVAAVTIQCVLSLALLRREFGRRLALA